MNNDKREINKNGAASSGRLEQLVMCCECLGDGKETCHNPDHGFLEAFSSHDIGRIGCPCCGHDEKHKVKNGGACGLCGGTGKTTENDGNKFCKDMDYDYEYIQDTFAT